MPKISIMVRAFWDDEAKVWVASSDDIVGLATEAETVELLTKKVFVMISELLALNGGPDDLPEIPVHIMAEQCGKVANPAFA
jgi:hypothetical protein